MANSRVSKNSRASLSFVLNVFLILSLLLGPVISVGSVSAQAPTEPPIEEPIAEPTVEPTESTVALPNLVFAAPEGWDAPLVISSQAGSHTNDPLTEGEEAYLDMSVFNNGEAAAGAFNVCLNVDTHDLQCWEVSALEPGTFFSVEDWLYPGILSEGVHTFTVTIDAALVLVESDETDNRMVTEFTWSAAEINTVPNDIDNIIINGPPNPPPGFNEQPVEVFPQDAVILEVPAYDWVFGCSAVSAAMIAGYYDNHGFQNMYTGSTNSGVMPLNDTFWSTWTDLSGASYPNNPLVASHDGVDGRSTKGSIDDYWIRYNNYDDDPYISGGWKQHTWGTAVGDYMKTSQSKYGNVDGSTIFYLPSYAEKLTCAEMASRGIAAGDGTYGLKSFYEARGYTVSDCYIQQTDNQANGAFNFANFKAEIDAGYPVMIHVWGHSMVGVGYDSASSTIYIHDTWGDYTEQMPWGGEYSGMEMWGVSIVHPETPANPIPTAPSGGIFDLNPTYSWTSIIGATGYQLKVTNLATPSTPIINETVDTSYCDGICNYDSAINLTPGQYKFEVAKRTSSGIGKYSSPMYFGSNDGITSPTTMVLGTTYTQDTTGSGIDAGDPVNVCNTGDTSSVWYQYKVPSGGTGIYTVDAYGSDYDPNLTILKKGSGSSYTPVVCGETNGYWMDESSLSFQGDAGSTYLIGVSSIEYGELVLKLAKETCPSGYACGVGVEGDGRVMHWPDARVYNLSNWSMGYGYGEFSGFLPIELYAASSGTYRTIISGEYSMASAMVKFPSIFTASAVGSPQASVTVKDVTGEPIATDNMAIVGEGFGDFMEGTGEDGASKYYLPAGTYSFHASNSEAGLLVYKPGYTLTSAHTTTPLTIDLDASQLPRDTFSFDVDDTMQGDLWIYSPDRYGHYQSYSGDRVVTFAAPEGTVIPVIRLQFQQDDDSSMEWRYNLELKNAGSVPIVGGADHYYQAGGGLTVTPYALDTPIRLGENANIYPGVTDAYGNSVSNVYYYGYSDSGGLSVEGITDPARQGERFSESLTEDGIRYERSIPEGEADLQAQDWVFVDVYPTYTVTDPDGHPTTHTPEYQYFSNRAIAPISLSSPTGSWTIKETVDLGPYGGGVREATSTFEVYPYVENDSITSPTTMVLGNTYTQDTSGAGIDAGDPVNVCNTGDTGSVWYQYKVPSGETGIYTVNVYDSDYDPNLTILKKGSGSSYTPVVCGETDDSDSSSVKAKLSFQGDAGSTYLIGVSSTEYGELVLKLAKETCPSGYACGVGVEGDGRVMHEPYAYVWNSTNDWIGYGNGYYSGFLRVRTYGAPSGTYRIVPIGKYSMVNNMVKFPGIFTASAVGSPKANVAVKDDAGIQIATDEIVIVGSRFGGLMAGTKAVGSKVYYLPADTYSFFASSDKANAGLMVYDLGYTLTNAHKTTPLTVDLDASELDRDTFSFDVDETMSGKIWILSPKGYGPEQSYRGDKEITYAAPAGTVVPFIDFQIEQTDSSSIKWTYELQLKYTRAGIPIVGGTVHYYQAGGGLTVTPYAWETPFRLDEGFARIYYGVYDSYGNLLERIEKKSDSGGLSTESRAGLYELGERITEPTIEDGISFERAIPESMTDLQAQDSVYVYPTYTVTDPNGAVTTKISDYQYLASAAMIPLSSSSPTGTWEFRETVDLGPYGGGVREGETTFEVYSVNTYPLENDAFATPIVLPGLLDGPYESDVLNTMSATTETTDPIIPNTGSQGYASVWFKYVADADGLLQIDTQGSDYDTVLTVWKGSQGKLTNLALGKNTYDEYGGWISQSKVELAVQQGQTYYIEVTQYVNGDWENPNIQSLELDLTQKPELQPERVGGYLHLNAKLVSCFALTLSSSAGGTVAASPAPNCTIGTKKLYAAGTEITVSGTKASNYGFLRWTDPVAEVSSENPYTFNINGTTALKGNFVLLAAPGNLDPATNWLTNDNTPDFSWGAVTYGSTYEIQIDNAAAFTIPLEQAASGLDSLSYTAEPALADGVHYWRVRTLNDRGEPGAWSAARSFTVDTTPPAVPALLTPAASAWVRGTPAFTWSAPATATAYVFEYAEDETFTSNVVSSGTLTTAKYTPATLALGEYWWHVKTRDAAGNWSEYSAGRKVSIISPLPAAPVLMLPLSGKLTNGNPVSFSWSEPPYAESYEMQLSVNNKFTPVLESIEVNDPEATQTFSKDGVYYWRVRGLTNLGEPGAWSVVRSFTLDTLAPAAPAAIAPAAGSYTTTLRPTFTVGASATAKMYGFEVSLQDGVDFIPLWEGRSTKPSYVPSVAQELPFGQLYWRAYAEDAAGNRSSYTDEDGTPFQVSILKTPANNSFVTTLPAFTWTAVTGATGYGFRLGTSLSGDDVTPDVKEIDLPVSATYKMPTTEPLTIGESYYWQICVYKGGACSAYTPAYSFTIATAPPAAPALALPKSGTVTKGNPVSFSWNSVANAASYHFQVSRVSNFATLVEDDPAQPNNLREQSGFDDGLHYWRVRGLNAQGSPGAWSKTFTFTIDTTAPVIPTAILPAEGTVVNTYTPKFTVNKIADAKWYTFEVCENDAFTGGNCDAEKLRFRARVTTPSYVPTAAQAMKVAGYYWRAMAEDATGNVSDWSSPILYYVTNQKTPAEGAVIITATTTKPAFTWLAYPGATGYDLKVVKNPSNRDDISSGEMVIEQSGLLTPKYTVPVGSELGAGTYCWTLTNHTGAVSVGTGIYCFIVSPAAPAAPLLLAPAIGGQTKVSPVQLDWNEPVGATEYDVQISRVKTFTTLDANERVSESDYDFEPALDGLYYWRVRSVNTYGVAGDWSQVRTFVYDTVGPVVPVLSAPLNGAAVLTQTPQLSVVKLTDAVRYEFEVFSDEALGVLEVTGISLTNTFSVPPAEKLAFGKYWWRARVYDKAGNESAWTAARVFEVTMHKTPLNGLYTTNPVQPFAWNGMPGATGYEIQVCTDLANCDGTQVRLFSRPVSTSYTPAAGEAFADGVYYWRMRYNSASGWSDWTLPYKFTKIH